MERFLVVTQDGKLLLIENGKVVHNESFGGGQETIVSMQNTKHGVAVASASGRIVLYNCTATETEDMKFAQKLLVPESYGQIVGMASAPSEDTILVQVSTNQILKLFINVSTDLTTTNQAEETTKIESFLESYHASSITGFDLCIRKPLLATCSSDKSIRVWNYLTGTCELMKYFGDEPQSISLHPSGLYLLAGFSDKLRLLNILMDDLRPVREFSVRACKKVPIIHH